MILFNFATRMRPTKFFSCLDNIKSLCTIPGHRILVKADEDDFSMNQDWVKMLAKTYHNVIMAYGTSGSKIAAINRNIPEHLDGVDIIVNMSDDLLFLEKGFDEIIYKDFTAYYPNFDGLLHYPDKFAGGRTCTHTIIGRRLYEQFGWMYHPDFLSVYCDNHLTDITRRMGKYTFINKKILEHMHPHAGLAAWDSQYKATEHPDVYAKDKATYLRLKENNYGL